MVRVCSTSFYASLPPHIATDLPVRQRVGVVRVVRHAAQREQNRRVEADDRVQPGEHVPVEAVVYASPHAAPPTLLGVHQVPRHRHVQRVLVERVHHLEQHVALPRLQLHLLRLLRQNLLLPSRTRL